MSVFYAPESGHAKESKKWEYGNPLEGYAGYREDLAKPYPKAMYRARQREEGGILIDGYAEAKTEAEQTILEGQGYHADQQDAILAVQAHNRELAELAANRAYHDRRMSPQAQAEMAAVDAESDTHLPVKPETPIKRRGRPKKAQPATETPS